MVAVSVSGDVVTVGAVGQGEAAVTVTASDAHGGSAEHTFAVTVPNRAPVVVEPIPDLGTSPGGRRALDLSRHLRDPDGDALDYAAVSSDAGVAAVSLSGATLTVLGLADGTAEVTVTAKDHAGLATGQEFAVRVKNRPPEPAGSIPGVGGAPGRHRPGGRFELLRRPGRGRAGLRGRDVERRRGVGAGVGRDRECWGGGPGEGGGEGDGARSALGSPRSGASR